VAARDAAGNVDPTPATRTFTVPVDDTVFKHKGAWKVRSAAAAFGGEFSRSTKKGSVLKLRVAKATGVKLVVSTAKRDGRVKVYLGKKLLRTVSLAGPRHRKVLKNVVTFAHPRSGVLKVKVAGHRRVRIEGVAVVR
jgi:hypothetical protein